MADIRKVILMVEASSAYGRRFLTGISQYAITCGGWQFYRPPSHYSHEQARSKRSMKRLAQWGADGAIVREPGADDPVIAMGLPTVVTPSEIKPRTIAAVVTDDAGAGGQAAEHLISRGLTRFAFCGYDDITWSVARGEGFRKTLVAAGYKTQFYAQPPETPAAPEVWTCSMHPGVRLPGPGFESPWGHWVRFVMNRTLCHFMVGTRWAGLGENRRIRPTLAEK